MKINYWKKSILKFGILPYVIALLITLLMNAQKAEAVYSGCKWPTNSMLYKANSLPTAWQDAVSYARNQWINVSPSAFDIFRNDTSINEVTLGPTPNGTSAITNWFCTGSTITEADVIFNFSLTWYTGSGSPGSSWDARSTATHEFGHVIGINHADSVPAGKCTNSDLNLRATMCLNASAGQIYKRTLTSYDNSDINAIYP